MARVALPDPYLSSQLIPYIGNKRRLLPFLDGVFDDLEREVAVRSFLDPFAGSGAVSRLARARGYEVTAGDWEPFSVAINRCHLEMDRSRLATLFAARGGLAAVLDAMNTLPAPPRADRYVGRHYAPADTAAADYRRERLFYTTENGWRIDAIRNRIEEVWPASASDAIATAERAILLAGLLYEAATHTNTSGVFKACHKGFGGHGREALGRILAPIRIAPPVLIDGARPAHVLAGEALAIACGHAVDFCYLDPPYNQHQYGSNYHLLNTITLWDRPPVSDEIVNGRLRFKAAIRPDWTATRSDYCSRDRAAGALAGLLDAVDARLIALSYSSDGIIPADELHDLLEAHGRVSLYTSAYVKFRGGRQSAARETGNTELLWVVERGRRPAAGTRAAVRARLERERLGRLLRGAFAPVRVRELLGGAGVACEPAPGLLLSMPALHRFAEPEAALQRLAALPPAARTDVERRLAAAACADRAEELGALAAMLESGEGAGQTATSLRRALQLLRKLAHRKYAAQFAAGATRLRAAVAALPSDRRAVAARGIAELEDLLRRRLAG